MAAHAAVADALLLALQHGHHRIAHRHVELQAELLLHAGEIAGAACRQELAGHHRQRRVRRDRLAIAHDGRPRCAALARHLHLDARNDRDGPARDPTDNRVGDRRCRKRGGGDDAVEGEQRVDVAVRDRTSRQAGARARRVVDRDIGTRV